MDGWVDDKHGPVNVYMHAQQGEGGKRGRKCNETGWVGGVGRGES